LIPLVPLGVNVHNVAHNKAKNDSSNFGRQSASFERVMSIWNTDRFHRGNNNVISLKCDPH